MCCDRNLLFLFFILSVATTGLAQFRNGSLFKTRVLTLDSCTVQLDIFTIVPGTVVMLADGDTLDQFEVNNKSVRFSAFACQKYHGRKIIAQFRAFTFDVSAPVVLPGSDSLRVMRNQMPGSFEYRSTAAVPSLIDAKGLDYRGSFSRGFSVGNSQSLVLNSNFDMQLKGDLGGGMQIAAAISDENLPIQAAGNTQQLQEFDKIFIRVSKGNSGITAGDYELASPKGYFMKYYKKLEGLSAYTSYQTAPDITLTSRASVAVSRGKFARRFISINEGNQGPYRLSGNYNERFIIVLSGTEKVFFQRNSSEERVRSGLYDRLQSRRNHFFTDSSCSEGFKGDCRI